MNIVSQETMSEARRNYTGTKKIPFLLNGQQEFAEKKIVNGEMAQGLVKKMLRLPENPTAEQISGEIDSVLADNTVKAVLAQAHIVSVPPQGGTEGSDNSDGFFTKATVAL